MTDIREQIDRLPYVGVDAARNLHIHVCGKCYTNDELTITLEKMLAENNELKGEVDFERQHVRDLRIENEKMLAVVEVAKSIGIVDYKDYAGVAGNVVGVEHHKIKELREALAAWEAE